MKIRECSNFVGTTDTQESQMFWLECGNRFFSAPLLNVLEAEYHFNRNYVLRGYTTLNELYEFLGLDGDQDGDQYGWTPESGFEWIDFSHRECTLGCKGNYTSIHILPAPEPINVYFED